MNSQDSNMAAQAICFAAEMIKESWRQAAADMVRPSILLKPKLFIDGDQWCALYGENLQDGLTGFGDSPAGAMFDFDVNWTTKLEIKS